jgi:hypothetical protein
VFKGLACCQPLVRILFEKTFHQIYLNIIHYGSVTYFESFRVRNVRKLQPLIAGITAKFIV